MKRENGIGYLSIVSILLLTLIPFVSRITAPANTLQPSSSHCHQATSVTPKESDLTHHATQNVKHTANPDSWTSMCDYCDLFMHVPVLIYVNAPIIKVFVSISVIKNSTPEFVKAYHYNSHLIRAPPLFKIPIIYRDNSISRFMFKL
ncbi:DUF2946 domain-containing protein [Gilliamella sp. wkB112]|uniref:DUF2946 domain-containing protein n=1 Tax=Gilliamella sp. wkB112 TaxID=3120257 RepID=UPI00080DF567|nr:DUF2946 domain-containing protein [Gilliamella apicola]OCG03111.1 hypothetical protein A9G12_09365 [Gilliamella apicola]